VPNRIISRTLSENNHAKQDADIWRLVVTLRSRGQERPNRTGVLDSGRRRTSRSGGGYFWFSSGSDSDSAGASG